MVSKDLELASKQIVPELLECIQDCKTFPLDNTILLFRTLECAACIGNHMAVMLQHCTEANTTGICLQNKLCGLVVKSWVCQDWCMDEASFEGVEWIVAVLRPLECCTLLCQGIEGGCNICKARDVAKVIRCQAQELVYC